MKLTRIHYEIIKFIIVGGINTFNYYIAYLFLLKVLHVNYMVSHIVGFIVSFIISYYLNCYFVYKVKPTIEKFLRENLKTGDLLITMGAGDIDKVADKLLK